MHAQCASRHIPKVFRRGMSSGFVLLAPLEVCFCKLSEARVANSHILFGGEALRPPPEGMLIRYTHFARKFGGKLLTGLAAPHFRSELAIQIYK